MMRPIAKVTMQVVIGICIVGVLWSFSQNSQANVQKSLVTFETNDPSMEVFDLHKNRLDQKDKILLHNGLNRLIVTSNHQSQRELRIWRYPSQNPEALVIHTPLYVPRNATKIFFEPITKPLSRGRSVCQSNAAWFGCNRTDIIDDLTYAGYFYDDPQKLSGLSYSSKTFVNQHPKHREQSYLLSDAEELLARFPASSLAYSIAARENFLAQDCHRVREIATYAKQLNLHSANLMLTLGICYELSGNPLQAEALWQAEAISHPHPQLSYHRARVLLKKNPVKGLKIAQACVYKWPDFAPCHEMSWQLSHLRSARIPLMSAVDWKAFRQQASPRIQDLETQTSDAKSTLLNKLALIGDYRSTSTHSFEALALEILLKGKADAHDSAYFRQFSVANVAMAARLALKLESLLPKEEFEGILSGLTHAAWDHPGAWWPLLQFHHNRKACDLLTSCIGEAKNLLSNLPDRFWRLSTQCRNLQKPLATSKTDHDSW